MNVINMSDFILILRLHQYPRKETKPLKKILITLILLEKV